MVHADKNLVRYVQLQTVQKSLVILFESLSLLIEKMAPESRVAFCQSLQEQIQECLRETGEDYSAHAGLLGVMCRASFQQILDRS